MPEFALPIRQEFNRHPNDEPAFLTSMEKGSVSDADIDRIATICSEELIYEVLFKSVFKGRPYTRESAEYFVNKAAQGWKDRSTFIFLVRDKNLEVVAAVDIKSNNKESAEVGYWASKNAPGYMTNALIALIKVARQAGFKELYGLTVPDNDKSKQVLTRAGFGYTGKEKRKNGDKKYHKFVIKL